MYQGTIVEEGPVDDVLRPPYHPYTELLLSSVPLIGRDRREPAAPAVGGAAASVGCKFAARCARKIGPVCDTLPPPLQQAGPGHVLRCHIPLSELTAVPHWLGSPA
jgi:peptide/nickel transport system ATP-binding protein